MAEAEKARYFRQILLEDFGERAQEKLAGSSVLVAGAGGLGSPLSIYLTVAGVGRIIVWDYDRVELSNLNRQILHETPDIGKLKTSSALERLEALNPEVNIEIRNTLLDTESISSLPGKVDIIADCLDNLSTRMALNGYSIETGTPVMHGGIDGWHGQVSLLDPPGTPCMACLFGKEPDRDKPAPVLGAVAGILGTVQALEIIKFLAGIGEHLKNRLMHFDGIKMEWTALPIERDRDCEVCSRLH